MGLRPLDFESETAGSAFRLKFQVVDSLHSSAPTFGLVCLCFGNFDRDGHILGTIRISHKLRHSNGRHGAENREPRQNDSPSGHRAGTISVAQASANP